ncbi:MAG TPA: hypothetical protein VKC61_22855 [Pyrinomonadaceae bacterium]|nr:hypothetical protein [Pyrinomonadaceae bacterium]
MGWKGALRSMEAGVRRAERESRRQQNELLRQQKQLQKMLERDRAAFEVQLHENRVDLLRSVHKECGPRWDWRALVGTPAPVPPVRTHNRQEKAASALEKFLPGFWDKLFRRVESKREALRRTVESAEDADAREYLEALSTHQGEFSEWQEKREIARRVIAGDLQAFKEVIEELAPFSELSDLGSSVSFKLANSSTIDVTLTVNGQDVIPGEIKSLLQSGRLSTKKMPQSRFYELYQDYICGCVLRVARELFALLPFDTVIVTAVGDVVNAQTGHLEEKPLLSVAIPRRTLGKLDLDAIDPSESMKNFIHRMAFKKNKGFMVVERIEPASLSN